MVEDNIENNNSDNIPEKKVEPQNNEQSTNKPEPIFDIDKFIKEITDDVDKHEKLTQEQFKKNTESIVKGVSDYTNEKISKIQEIYDKRIKELEDKLNNVSQTPVNNSVPDNPYSNNKKELTFEEKRKLIEQKIRNKYNL